MEDKKLKETLEFDAMEDFKSEVYNALSEIYAKYELKGATLKEFDSAVDFATIHMRDEFDGKSDESLIKVKCIEDYMEDDEEGDLWSAGKIYDATPEDSRGNRKIKTNFGTWGNVGPDYLLDEFNEFFEVVEGESLKEDAKDIDVEAEVEEPKEDAKEPKLETFEEKIDFLVKDEDEAIAGYDKIIAMLGEDDANAIEQLNHIKEEEVAHKDFLEVLKGDKEAVYEHDDEEEHDESLKEDEVKEDLETQKQAAFENACDCLKYGYGRDKWNSCGLSKENADEVWKKAFEKMSKDEAKEEEVEEPKEEEPVEEHPIETTVEEVKEIASEVANKVVEPVSNEEDAEEQQEKIEDVVDEVVDDKFGEDDEEDEDEMIVRDNDEFIDVDDDFDDDFGFGEGLKEDTVKKDNKWVNKGKEGTHGEFKTKKEADAQRKAMFANGYREEVEEDIDDDFGSGNFIAEEAEEFGVTVNWDDMEDGVDEEDAKTFKKVIKNTDDKILDKHFGKDTPERKLVGAIKDMDEEAHETGHIKAKKPIELRARR